MKRTLVLMAMVVSAVGWAQSVTTEQIEDSTVIKQGNTMWLIRSTISPEGVARMARHEGRSSLEIALGLAWVQFSLAEKAPSKFTNFQLVAPYRDDQMVAISVSREELEDIYDFSFDTAAFIRENGGYISPDEIPAPTPTERDRFKFAARGEGVLQRAHPDQSPSVSATGTASTTLSLVTKDCSEESLKRYHGSVRREAKRLGFLRITCKHPDWQKRKPLSLIF